MKGRKHSRRWLPLPAKLFIMGLMPLIAVAAFLLFEHFRGPFSVELLRLLGTGFFFVLFFHYYALWRVCNEPFHALANFVNALHLGDYSQRVRAYPSDDSLSVLHEEINRLADVLQDNRFAAVESVKRFQYLIDQLEIGVVAFSENKALSWVNLHFARLYQQTPTQLVGRDLGDLGLEALWECESGRTLWLNLPDKSSRFLVHTNAFRDEGRPQRLFLLTDLKHPLREEERTAWRRLIRVLGHELNNSLTPITSLAQTMKTRVARASNMPDEWRETSTEALDIITQRAQSMNRFVNDYSKLAKLPEPTREPVSLCRLIGRCVSLLNHPAIAIEACRDCEVMVDSGQLEQLFLNVLRNAIDALPGEDGCIRIHWSRKSTDAVIHIDDNGPGFESEENLFVPFFSTKQGGSGIGLVLSRQIAEGNGGAIHLSNRPEGGCRATVILPLNRD